MASVSIEKLIEKMDLVNITPEVDVSSIKIHQPDINRPALQLAGYFEHYEETRPQIIGFVEYSYMENMPQEQKMEVYPKVLTDKTPCVIFCRDLEPDEDFKRIAIQNNVPWLSRHGPISDGHGFLS